ncbi:MAG: HD domain-containing phosphohydrolase [Chloroflexota bacterium]
MKPRQRLRLDVQIALTYALFGGLWIFLTDFFVSRLTVESAAITRLQSMKGVIFVALSAVVIFVLLRHELKLRRVKEREAEESAKKLQVVLRNAPITIFTLDRQGRFTFSDGRGLEGAGLKPTENVGVSAFELYGSMPFVDFNGEPFSGSEIIQRALAGETFSVVNEIDGTYFDNRIGPIHNSAGEIVGIVGVATDITERKRAEEELKRQNTYLTTLQDIDFLILSVMDMNVSLDMIARKTASLLHADAATILLLNPVLNLLECGAAVGFRSNTVKTATVKIGESYAGRAVQERQLVQIPDLSMDPNEPFQFGFLKEEGIKGYSGMPLVAKGKVIGVLELFHRSVVARDAEWLNIFRTLSNQAAIAIENAQMFEDMQRSHMELSAAYDATIEGWSHAMDLRDKETEGHTQRVTELTLELAQRMGVAEQELTHIRRGALLHDIGKLGVPDHILLKPDKLTDDEWTLMRQHPVLALNMLSSITYLRPALDIPYCHHEKWNGTGYPRGLVGASIPLAARIFAVADVYDALTSDRPYRPAWTREQALEHIRQISGSHFDPQVVELFMQWNAEREARL